MNKLIICLAGCLLLTAPSLRAQDAGNKTTDSVRQVSDSARQKGDSAMPAKDSAKQVKDTSILQPVARIQQDNSTPASATENANTHPAPDTAAQESKPSTKRELDTRWFISPLLKAQFQDFGMIEKNRKG